jgi:hypothetical protein
VISDLLGIPANRQKNFSGFWGKVGKLPQRIDFP